jgi:valyl-tRNA synthetase
MLNSSTSSPKLSDAEFAKLSIEKQYQYLKEQYPEADIDWKYKHNVTICERSKTVVEPLISQEFFVDYYKEFDHKPVNSPEVLDRISHILAQKSDNFENDKKAKKSNESDITNTTKNSDLAAEQKTKTTLQKLALEGIDEVEFLPIEYRERAVKYFQEIKNWCISRDLIWGHKMPIWYNLEHNPNRIFYTFEEFEANKVVKEIAVESNSIQIKVQDCFQISVQKPQIDGEWVQESKILDTWFSSTLWPLSTLDFAGFAEKQKQKDEIQNDIEILEKLMTQIG